MNQEEKEIDKQFVEELSQVVRRYKIMFMKIGLKEIEAKAIIASALQFASKNADKFREEAGI